MGVDDPGLARAVRVVQVLPVDGIGGVEAAARSALEPTRGMEFAIAPIAQATDGSKRPGILAPRYHSPDDPRALADTVRRVLRFRPDVVVGSLWRSVPVLLLLKLLRPRLKIVYFLHVENVQHLPDRLLSAAGIAAANEVWCDSAATQQSRLARWPRKPSRVISFVTERLSPATSPVVKPKFVIWARLNHQKGIDRAILLIAALMARGLDARYDIHGPDGGERATLERSVNSAGLVERVAFKGPLPAAARADAARDATFFLQLSRFEGMAMGIVEAMQLGLVPVVTAVGEVARYVRDGENGVVIDPHAPEVAADRICALLREPRRVEAMQSEAAATWNDVPLYRDDIAESARRLLVRV